MRFSTLARENKSSSDFQLLFPLILLDGSFSSCGKFPPACELKTVEVCSSPTFFLSTALSSCAFCLVNSSPLDLSGLPALLPNLGKAPDSPRGSPSQHPSLETVQAVNRGSHRAHRICFKSPSDHCPSLFDIQCPVSDSWLVCATFMYT